MIRYCFQEPNSKIPALGGDKVDSYVGSSYRPGSPCSLASRYDNPNQELTLSPKSGSMNSATGHSGRSKCLPLFRARICKRLRSPGIDSEESISSTYVAWRAGTKNRVVVPARQAGNRFLVSLKGLQIQALAFLRSFWSLTQSNNY
jgi:hypothetical protein